MLLREQWCRYEGRTLDSKRTNHPVYYMGAHAQLGKFCNNVICIGNYTVREVLMKNRPRVWRHVHNIINYLRYYKYFAKHK